MLNKKYALLLLSSILTLSLNAWGNPELKGAPDELREFLHPRGSIINLYAEAEKTAYSDKAIISLIVTTEEDKLSDALSKNSELRKNISEQLVQSGIKNADIKTSKFSNSPQMGWFGDEPKSYKTINRMSINITRESHLQIIAEIADSLEQVKLSSTSFEHTKKEELKEFVKKQALSKVIEQKQFYEESLNIKLIPIHFRNVRFNHIGTKGANQLSRAVAEVQKSSASSAKLAIQKQITNPSSSFDEIKYRAAISVDFKVINNPNDTLQNQ